MEPKKSAPSPAAPPTPPSVPTRAEAPPARNLHAEARALSDAWSADARQIQDESKRSSALAAIREALSSGDPVRVLAGLFAVTGLVQVSYDKASMHTLVLPCLESEEPLIRRQALWGLLATDAQPGDVQAVLRLEKDPDESVRQMLPAVLARASNGELTGDVARAILSAIESMPPREVRNTLNSLPWKNASPELEAKVLALARAPETRSDVIYYLLSGMSSKSPGVVEVLCEAASDPDRETRSRALWGLSWGISESERPRAAAALMESLEKDGGASGETHTTFRGLQSYGTETEALALERLAANPLAPEAIRKEAARAAEAIRNRIRK